MTTTNRYALLARDRAEGEPVGYVCFHPQGVPQFTVVPLGHPEHALSFDDWLQALSFALANGKHYPRTDLEPVGLVRTYG